MQYFALVKVLIGSNSNLKTTPYALGIKIVKWDKDLLENKSCELAQFGNGFDSIQVVVMAVFGEQRLIRSESIDIYNTKHRIARSLSTSRNSVKKQKDECDFRT